jgi:hypothetical protein
LYGEGVIGLRPTVGSLQLQGVKVNEVRERERKERERERQNSKLNSTNISSSSLSLSRSLFISMPCHPVGFGIHRRKLNPVSFKHKKKGKEKPQGAKVTCQENSKADFKLYLLIRVFTFFLTEQAFNNA